MMAGVNRKSDEWQSEAFRMSMVKKLEEAIQEHGLQGQKDPQTMEQQIFMRAKTGEDYLNCIARFILMIQNQRNNAGGGSNVGQVTGGGQVIQQDQGLSGMGTSGVSSSGNMMPQFQIQGQQMQAGQQINMQQPIQQQQIPINQQQMMRGQLQHRLGQGNIRIQGQPGMPVMMQGNRMPPGQPQQGNIIHRNPTQLIPGASHAPPTYPGGPSPGMPSMSVANTFTGGPSPGGPVTGFVQSPANQSLMSPSPMGGGPRSVGSPLIPTSQSIATPQQGGDAAHDQRQDEQAYLEKVKQLGKYIEPLRRMIARIGNEDQEKLSKMNKLMDILSNPNKRMPMETLLKCEAVLEKMNLDTSASQRPGGVDPAGNETKPSYTIPSPSSSGINPLLDAVIKLINAHQKVAGTPSPSALPLNHTLHRSFAPLEAIYGPEISVPSISEIRKSSSSFQPEQEDSGDIPDVIQGEVAKLQSHFKVSLDASQPAPNFSEIYTICQLEDRDLPSVPPLNITIPRNYPESASPICSDLVAYETTPFLNKVKDALMARMAKLPHRHSLSQLLSAWEMSVRAACSLRQMPNINVKGF